MTRWFYKSGEKSIGPLTARGLRMAAYDGLVTRETMVRREGVTTTNWHSAQDADATQRVFAKPLDMSWYWFWSRCFLSLSALLDFANFQELSDLSKSTGLNAWGEFLLIATLPVIFLKLTVAVGLSRRRFWAWQLNWLVIVISWLSASISNSGGEAEQFFWNLTACGLFLVWPQYIYWRKRWRFFTSGSNESVSLSVQKSVASASHKLRQVEDDPQKSLESSQQAVSGDEVRVHAIRRTRQFDDQVERDEGIMTDGTTYELVTWRIGQDVTAEEADENRDPETGELFVAYNEMKDGEWSSEFIGRDDFQQIKGLRDNAPSEEQLVRQSSESEPTVTQDLKTVNPISLEKPESSEVSHDHTAATKKEWPEERLAVFGTLAVVVLLGLVVVLAVPTAEPRNNQNQRQSVNAPPATDESFPTLDQLIAEAKANHNTNVPMLRPLLPERTEGPSQTGGQTQTEVVVPDEQQTLAELLKPQHPDAIDRIVAPFESRLNAFDHYEAGIERVRESEANQNPKLSDRQWEQALQLFRDAASVDPTYPEPHIALGCMYFHNEDDQAAAIQFIDAALELDPHHADAYFYRAHVQHDAGNDRQALVDLESAIECDQRLGLAYRLRARIREQQGNFVGAAIDTALAESYGEADGDWTYPWSVRDKTYVCQNSGWSLKYSSDWYPSRIQLEGQPETFRLIRKLNGRRLIAAFTVLPSAGSEYDVVAPDVIANVQRAILKEQLPEAAIEVVESGVTTISSCRVPWCEITVRRPSRSITWNQFYWLQSDDHAWMIQLSTDFEPDHVSAALAICEPVLSSITIEKPTTVRPETRDVNLALTSFGVGDLEWLVPLQYFRTKYPHALFEGERSGTKTYIFTGTFCGRQVRVNYAFNSGDETLVLVLVTFIGDSSEKTFEATEQILSKQIGGLKRSPAPGFTIRSEGQHYATTVTHNLINALTGVSVEQVMFGKLVGKVPSYDSTNIPRLDLEISESGWGRYNWGLSAAEFQKLHPLAEPKVQQGLSTRRVKMVVAGRYAPVAFGFSNNQLVVISISPTARINDAIFNKHRKLLDGKFGPFTKVATPPGTNVTDQYQGEFGSTGILHMRFRHDKRVGEGITLFDRRMQ